LEVEKVFHCVAAAWKQKGQAGHQHYHIGDHEPQRTQHRYFENSSQNDHTVPLVIGPHHGKHKNVQYSMYGYYAACTVILVS
jgi:hypothetical protein